MKPFIIFMLNKNYDIDRFLRSVDLYNLIDDDGSDVIAMWCALLMMRYLAVKEGIDVPLRIVADDACFAPMRDMLLPDLGLLRASFNQRSLPFQWLQLQIHHRRNLDASQNGISQRAMISSL